MTPEETYELLRNLTTPVVAITVEWQGKRNGMIADSAMRASLSKQTPRVSVLIHKWNLSHDLIRHSGRFALHLLHTRQFDVVYKLGFASGRDRDKLSDIPYRISAEGCPILEDCYAYLLCRVVNLMDAGGATCYLADVVAAGRGPGRKVMTAQYLRTKLPTKWLEPFLTRLKEAQEFSDTHSYPLRALSWPGVE